MDVAKVLAELRAELESLDAAIDILEGLQEDPRAKAREWQLKAAKTPERGTRKARASGAEPPASA
jgi:hypothetical protein